MLLLFCFFFFLFFSASYSFRVSCISTLIPWNKRMQPVTIGCCLSTKQQVEFNLLCYFLKSVTGRQYHIVISYIKATFLCHPSKHSLCFDTVHISQVSAVLSVAPSFLLLRTCRKSALLLGISCLSWDPKRETFLPVYYLRSMLFG